MSEGGVLTALFSMAGIPVSRHAEDQLDIGAEFVPPNRAERKAAIRLLERIIDTDDLPGASAFHWAVNKLPVGLVMIDETHTIIEANEKYIEMTGRSVMDVIGSKIYDLYTPESRARSIASLDEISPVDLTQEAMHIRRCILRPDGSRFPIRMTVAAFVDDHNCGIGVVEPLRVRAEDEGESDATDLCLTMG